MAVFSRPPVPQRSGSRSGSVLDSLPNPFSACCSLRWELENNNVVAATVAKLKSGWDFVIFPEGHSSTNHKILQVLNGAAWTLMEYSKTHPSDLQPVIIPVCLVYSDKSTFRSRVHITYGAPIGLETLSNSDSWKDKIFDPKETVHLLTDRLRASLVENTLNSKDWETLNAAVMATSLLEIQGLAQDWSQQIQQLIVTLSSSDSHDRKLALSNYHSLLQHSLFIDSEVFSSRIPLPFLLASAFHPIFLLCLPLAPTYLFAWFISWAVTPSGRPEGVGPHKSLFGQRVFLATITGASVAICAVVGWQHLPTVFTVLFAELYFLHLAIADAVHLHFRRARTGFTLLIAKMIQSAPLDASELVRLQKPITYKRSQWLRKEFESDEADSVEVDMFTRLRVTRWHLQGALDAAEEVVASLR
ncbi:hypothetical protein C8J57DRAFT_1497285 [Mycena rebaudengoi]|nr:hypothetical protein C8J57DRAFT_1497285 [Mycena rebaudengoi]